jgi:putative ABC transport system substrate-binding protein
MDTMQTPLRCFSTVPARHIPPWIRAAALVFGLLAWLVPWNAWGASPPPHAGVLILNSNGAVKKYAAIESAFQSNLAKPTQRLDMEGDRGSPDALKQKLRSSGAELIYAIGSNAYRLARQNTDHPIVFSSILNWRRQQLGGNSYGIANELPSGMPLSMFRYLFPDLKTVGVLYSETFNKEWLAEAAAAAADVRIQLVGEKVDKPAELPEALARLLARVDALWLISDPVVLATETSAIDLFRQSDARQKPVFAYDEVYVDLGAALAITADIRTMGIQAAKLAEDVLTARESVSEHVQNPAGSHVTLNLGRIRRYGFRVNTEALGSVNRVIE